MHRQHRLGRTAKQRASWRFQVEGRPDRFSIWVNLVAKEVRVIAFGRNGSAEEATFEIVDFQRWFNRVYRGLSSLAHAEYYVNGYGYSHGKRSREQIPYNVLAVLAKPKKK